MVLKTTGTFNTTNGNVAADSNVSNPIEAMAGAYLTAYEHIGCDVGAAANVFKRFGFASNPSRIMLKA